MGVWVEMVPFPRDLFARVRGEPSLTSLLRWFWGRAGGPYRWFNGFEAELDEDVEGLVAMSPTLFGDGEVARSWMGRMVHELQAARTADPTLADRRVYFDKSIGVFCHLVTSAAQAVGLSVSGDEVDGLVFGRDWLADPADPNSGLGFLEAESLAKEVKWLEQLTADDLARAFDGPEMERVKLYGMRPWDPEHPRQMPSRWREDVADEFASFKSCILVAHRNQEVIVSGVA